MVENNITYYLENDLLYDVSNVAVLSNDKAVLNVVAPNLHNNAIVVTQEQLKSLGIHLDNNYVGNNTPVFANKSNIIVSSNKRPVKHSYLKSRSVLINKCHQNESVIDENGLNYTSINVPPCNVPISYSKNQPKKAYVKAMNQEVINPSAEFPNKVVYRILHPEELRLTDKKEIFTHQPLQYEPTQQNFTKIKVKSTCKSKEPVEVEKKIFKDDVEKPEVDKDILTLKSVRTRFGRLTKPPQHLKKDNATLENNEINDEPSKKQMRMGLNTEKIHNRVENSDSSTTHPVTNINIPIVEQRIPKRKISSTKFRCKTCHKFYLGRTRMKRHLLLNPDHKIPKIFEPTNQLWMDLVERTSKVPKADQAVTFFGELSNVLQKVKNIVPEALKPAMVENDNNSCQIDNFLASLLGIPEGKYTLDASVLKEDNANVITENNEKIDIIPDGSISIQNIDSAVSENAAQTSLLNLLDTGQVNFDTSDSAHTSEAVMCVDQLVQERLKTLTGVELSNTSPITHSSSNITLDLSMDLFSYHPS